jgi:hypothetical protein
LKSLEFGILEGGETAVAVVGVVIPANDAA